VQLPKISKAENIMSSFILIQQLYITEKHVLVFEKTKFSEAGDVAHPPAFLIVTLL
jgi:hypothetical protein